MQNQRNARFWTFINGDLVKLTLRPGQELHHSAGELHEEGFSRESHVWSHEGNHVREELTRDGRDCDGRYAHYADYVCPLDGLRTRWNEYGKYFAPAWQEAHAEQYDEFAELAGY